jgi:UDP-N-acetylmuramyl pentapeptide synthase
LLYLDCYNANPASMADALDAFYAVAPTNEPRLFVLGGMEELGPESEMFHRALGRSLRLRKQDFLFIIGDQAEALRSGALDSGSNLEQIAMAASVEVIAARVREWRGAVFVKGSRRYELEKVLTPPDDRERARVVGDAPAHVASRGSGSRGDRTKIDRHA